MITNVPQYIDIEDKVAGPLTAKQLFWMIGMGGALFLMWALISVKLWFYILAVPVALVFVALAFYKPFGQPLGGFIGHGFMFLFAPKIYVWRRMPNMHTNAAKKETVQTEKYQSREHTLSREQISGLAHLVDTEGSIRDKEALDLIASRQQAQNANKGNNKKRNMGDLLNLK